MKPVHLFAAAVGVACLTGAAVSIAPKSAATPPTPRQPSPKALPQPAPSSMATRFPAEVGEITSYLDASHVTVEGIRHPLPFAENGRICVAPSESADTGRDAGQAAEAFEYGLMTSLDRRGQFRVWRRGEKMPRVERHMTFENCDRKVDIVVAYRAWRNIAAERYGMELKVSSPNGAYSERITRRGVDRWSARAYPCGLCCDVPGEPCAIPADRAVGQAMNEDAKVMAERLHQHLVRAGEVGRPGSSPVSR